MFWKDKKSSARNFLGLGGPVSGGPVLRSSSRWRVFDTVIDSPPKTDQPEYRYVPPAPVCCDRERIAYREQARAWGLIAERPEESQPTPSATESPHVKDDATYRNERPAAFEKFLELPPELRELIYISYMHLYNQNRLSLFKCSTNDEIDSVEDCYKPIPPHEPPITRVSRQVRKESRPLFYSIYRFPLVAHLEENDCYSCVTWYNRLDADCLSSIRRLELYICFEKRDRKLGGFKTTDDIPADAFVLQIDLKDTNSYVFRRDDHISPNAAFGNRLVNLDDLERSVLAELDFVLARRGVGNLIAGDFKRLIPADKRRL